MDVLNLNKPFYYKPKWYNGIAKIAASFLVILGLSNCRETPKEQLKSNANKVNSVDSNDYKVLGIISVPNVKSDSINLLKDSINIDSLLQSE